MEVEKEPAEVEVVDGGESTKAGIPPFMDERHSKQIQVIMLIRNDIRVIFGIEYANQCGFFIDRNMSKKIFDFQDWIPYPKGDRVLEEHSDGVRSAVLSTDGYFLYTGSSNGTIIAWNMVDFSKIGQWQAHTETIHSLAFHTGLLASCCYDKSIRLWNARKSELIRTLNGHNADVRAVIFNAKGDQLISGSADFSIKVWSVKTGDCLKTLSGHGSSVIALLFADNLIISGSHDKSIKLWDPTKDEEPRTITEGINHRIYDLAMNCDSSLLCCTFDNGSTIFNWPEMKVERTIDIESTICTFNTVLPNIIALCDYVSDEIKIYDVYSGEIIRTFEGHSHRIFSITFTDDAYRMVSVSHDKTVRIWDVSFLLDRYQ